MPNQQVYMTNPQDTYRKQKVMTASPLELTIMLYEGCRKYLILARRSMEKKDIQQAHKHMIRAQDIVSELLGSLDLSLSVGQELMKLYDYLLTAMMEANMKKDPEAVDPILEMVEELRDTWQQVNEAQKGSLYMREAAQNE